MEQKAKRVADHIIKTACANATCGQYSVKIEDVCSELGMTEQEYIEIFGVVVYDLCERPEIVDLVDVGDGTIDLGIAKEDLDKSEV